MVKDIEGSSKAMHDEEGYKCAHVGQVRGCTAPGDGGKVTRCRLRNPESEDIYKEEGEENEFTNQVHPLYHNQSMTLQQP
jgi:hypothetical protein